MITFAQYLLREQEESKVLNGPIEGINYLEPSDIHTAEDLKTQKANKDRWKEDHPGKSDEDWAKYSIKYNKEPLEAHWHPGEGNGYHIKIHDGHHRYLAHMILNKPIRIIVIAHGVPRERLNAFLSGNEDVGFDPKTGKYKK